MWSCQAGINQQFCNSYRLWLRFGYRSDRIIETKSNALTWVKVWDRIKVFVMAWDGRVIGVVVSRLPLYWTKILKEILCHTCIKSVEKKHVRTNAMFLWRHTASYVVKPMVAVLTFSTEEALDGTKSLWFSDLNNLAMDSKVNGDHLLEIYDCTWFVVLLMLCLLVLHVSFDMLMYARP